MITASRGRNAWLESRDPDEMWGLARTMAIEPALMGRLGNPCNLVLLDLGFERLFLVPITVNFNL